MITHIIYHIPDRKVGCTKDLDQRKKWYKSIDGISPEIEVLEELYDKSDQEAGDIEWQWADKLGYRRGSHYSLTKRINELSTMSTNKGGFSKFSVEKRKAISRKNVELGKTGFQQSNISEIARLGGLVTGPKTFILGIGVHAYSKEQRKVVGSQGGLKSSSLKLGGMYISDQCPHCGIKSTKASLARWHHNNCKKRPMVRGN